MEVVGRIRLERPSSRHVGSLRKSTPIVPALYRGIPSVELTSCFTRFVHRLTGDLSLARPLCDVDTGNGWDLTARSRAGSGHR
jgi:hypothetical protein